MYNIIYKDMNLRHVYCMDISLSHNIIDIIKNMLKYKNRMLIRHLITSLSIQIVVVFFHININDDSAILCQINLVIKSSNYRR